MTIINQTEHKICIRDLSSCEGVLESPNSLSQAGSEDWASPGENPERPIPNCRTDNPKTGDMTDMSMGKKPASLDQATAQEWLLANLSNCWQK